MWCRKLWIGLWPGVRPGLVVVVSAVVLVLSLWAMRPVMGQSGGTLFLPQIQTGAASGEAPSSSELIDEALARGEIDEETALLYKVYAAFGDARLPANYQGVGDELDTIVMREVAGKYATLSAQAQDTLAPFFQPPIYADSWYALQKGQMARASASIPDDEECAFDPGPGPLPSDGWACADGTTANIRVWWQVNQPEQARMAQRILQAMQADIWPKLVILMRREPQSDKGPHHFVDLNGEEQVWWDGGDGRLDIYIVQPPPRTGGAATIAYPPGCDLRPSFMLISPQIPEDTLLPGLVHEFFHTFQFSTDQGKQCDEYGWWSEATANWAIDFVYPQDNWEHRWAYSYMQRSEWRSSIHDQVWGGRSSYLLPLYLTKQSNDPGIIRRSWENAARFPNNSLAAIDNAVGGQLTPLWHQLAQELANQEPADLLKNWDEIEIIVLGDPVEGREPVREVVGQTKEREMIEKLYTPVKLDNQPDQTYVLPAEIEPLAMRYYRFVFQDATARSVAFLNPLFANPAPDAKIYALIKMAGQAWRVEDWTVGMVQTFCRDEREGRIEEVLIIISNGQWRNRAEILSMTPAPALAVTNIGCYRWEGTFETEVQVQSGAIQVTDEYSGRIVFEPIRDLPKNPIYQYYTLVEASVTWEQHGTMANCRVEGGPTTFSDISLFDGNLQTASFSTNPEWDYRMHTGTVSLGDAGTVTSYCENQTITNDKFHGVIAAFGQGTKPITLDGLTLQGRHSESSIGSTMITTWRLSAKVEP